MSICKMFIKRKSEVAHCSHTIAVIFFIESRQWNTLTANNSHDHFTNEPSKEDKSCNTTGNKWPFLHQWLFMHKTQTRSNLSELGDIYSESQKVVCLLPYTALFYLHKSLAIDLNPSISWHNKIHNAITQVIWFLTKLALLPMHQEIVSMVFIC
jgi:hypothetical protein